MNTLADKLRAEEERARNQIRNMNGYGFSPTRLEDAIYHAEQAIILAEKALAVAKAKKRYQEAVKAHSGQAVSFSALVKARAEWMRVNYGE
ncbi:hypothetical protein UFOVP826_5 [uncultured Caudovirales phage]|uniref:Uncharacterized protein n=1 Tax=uncultured Caudovirales phage TaxID=2100421 RepID=A0A6J5NZC2_9CAUD|nr:hypothetical protein UFOVP826_5 [uncultured Caudovirales phage]